MTTRQLTLLDSAFRRPHDRRETSLWIAATASPVAWLAHRVGFSTWLAIAIIVVAGLVARGELRRLIRHGSRSRQRVWFLAQTGVVLAVVSLSLVLLAEAF